MTPDKARALLDGTTPGPWEVNPKHPGDGLSPDELARAQADAALIAAAPALAAMIAEMREEWAGQYLDCDGKWDTICTYPTREEVARHLDYLCWDAYTHTRITRRYVTEPEVIE